MFSTYKGSFGGYNVYGPQPASSGSSIAHSTAGSVGIPAAVLLAGSAYAVFVSFGGAAYVTFGGETGGSTAGGGISYASGDREIWPLSMAQAAKIYYTSSGSSYATALQPAS
jgi:hypothetical protein